MNPCNLCFGTLTITKGDGIVKWCRCMSLYGYRHNEFNQRQNRPSFPIWGNLSPVKKCQGLKIPFSQIEGIVKNAQKEGF